MPAEGSRGWLRAQGTSSKSPVPGDDASGQCLAHHEVASAGPGSGRARAPPDQRPSHPTAGQFLPTDGDRRRPGRNAIFTGRNRSPTGDNLVITSGTHAITSDTHVIMPDSALIMPDFRVIMPDKPVITPDSRVIMPDNVVIMSDNAVIMSDNAVVTADNRVITPDNPVITRATFAIRCANWGITPNRPISTSWPGRAKGGAARFCDQAITRL